MLLKNNSQKVIHVGNVMILPDETKPVDDSLSTAPAVAALIGRRALSIMEASAMPDAVNIGKNEPSAKAGRTAK